jgi:hypothetical protein
MSRFPRSTGMGWVGWVGSGQWHNDQGMEGWGRCLVERKGLPFEMMRLGEGYRRELYELGQGWVGGSLPPLRH